MLESFENPQERMLRLSNQMQVAIALNHGGDIDKFLEEKAGQFREIIEKNEAILDEFETNPEEALKKIDSILYH